MARVLSALVLLPLVIGTVWFLPPVATLALACVAALLAFVSHLPRGDWRIGAPYYFCALLQACAMLIAWRHFSRERTLKSLHPVKT